MWGAEMKATLLWLTWSRIDGVLLGLTWPMFGGPQRLRHNAEPATLTSLPAPGRVGDVAAPLYHLFFQPLMWGAWLKATLLWLT